MDQAMLTFSTGANSYFLNADAWAGGKKAEIRFLSAAGNKGSIKALDRIFKTKDKVSLFFYPSRVDRSHSVRMLSNPGRTWLRQLEHDTWQIVAISHSVSQGTSALAHNLPIDEAVLQALQDGTDVPLLPEWAPKIYAELSRQQLIKPWTAYGKAPKGADLDDAVGEIEGIVKRLLAQKVIEVPLGEQAPDKDITSITLMDTYMKTFGPALGRRFANVARHTPGTSQDPGLPRKLYPAQLDAATAIKKTWEDEKYVWMIGEPGVGKTLIGPAAAYMQLGGKPGRVLAHVPGHLIRKWEREIKQTIPGAKVFHIRNWHEALHALPLLKNDPRSIEFWIIGRDTAKLGWNWRPVAIRSRDKRAPWKCPSCGEVLVKTFKQEGRLPVPWKEDAFKRRGRENANCPSCSAPLWEADRSGPRRIAPSKLWSKYVAKGTFDVLIADEIHEEKGNSEQGISLARLFPLAKKVALLTGTLLGGKASDMHYHLARTQPRRMNEYGYTYRNPMPFVGAYGSTEKAVKDKKTHKTQSVKEKAGIHPALFGDWLMGRSVFLELADLGANLPEYEEEVHMVKMRPEQKALVDRVVEELRHAAARSLRTGKKGALGTYIQAAVAYPDRVWSAAPIYYGGKPLVTPGDSVDDDKLLPKESAIAVEVMREIAQGRRCAIFAEYTGVYDITQRLKKVLEDQGISVALLTRDVKQEERESWIAKRKEDVLICQPRLVATGLDLLEYPTIIWAQNNWSLYTMRQGSRRSWRIGQSKPVKVKFFAYEETIQETVLQVLAEKMLAAQAVEGRFSAEGIQAMAQGNNTTLRLAEALVYGLDDLPDVTDVWRREASEMLHEVELQAIKPADELIEAACGPAKAPCDEKPQTVLFDDLVRQAAHKKRRRRRRNQVDERQLTLFG